MLLFLLLVPLVGWLAIWKILLHHEITWGEAIIQLVVTTLVLTAVVSGARLYQTSDTMIVNGAITQATPVKKSCDQYWSDWKDSFCTNQRTRQVRDGNTCTTVNGKKSCYPKYKTQYQSVYPWEQRYFVTSDLPSKYEIKRVDRQGVTIPDRFAEIRIGDPVSGTVSYTNYIKGAADTLFNQKYDDVPPISYPSIRDYYKTSRVIYFGTPGSFGFVSDWNDDLAATNTAIRKTGANIIIAVTGSSPDWAERLAQSWDAHNINDLVVTIGVSQDKIIWTDVRSWSSNSLVNVVIRDEIVNLGVVDPTKIDDIIQDGVEQYYVARSMEEFEYLADDIPAPLWVYIVAAIILLLVTPAVTLFLSRNDVK